MKDQIKLISIFALAGIILAAPEAGPKALPDPENNNIGFMLNGVWSYPYHGGIYLPVNGTQCTLQWVGTAPCCNMEEGDHNCPRDYYFIRSSAFGDYECSMHVPGLKEGCTQQYEHECFRHCPFPWSKNTGHKILCAKCDNLLSCESGVRKT